MLFEAAFYCEIIRSAIGSVRAGQTEAALATGMKRWQVMRYIVLPQGLKVMTPLLLNQIIPVFLNQDARNLESLLSKSSPGSTPVAGTDYSQLAVTTHSVSMPSGSAPGPNRRGCHPPESS